MSVAKLLSENSFLSLLPTNRIKCTVTGHEMPPSVEAITAHLNGQRFKKAKEWYNYDFKTFEPDITQHHSKSNKLYCTVTQQILNKIPEEVRKHIQGKRFLRLKAEKEEQEKAKLANKLSKEKKFQEAKKKQQAKIDEEDEETDFWVPPEDEVDEEMEVDDEMNDEEGGEVAEEMEEEEDSDEDEEEEEKVQPNKKVTSSKSIHSKKRKIIEEDDGMIIIKKQVKSQTIVANSSSKNKEWKEKGQIEQ